MTRSGIREAGFPVWPLEVFIVILIANFLSMLAMNALILPTGAIFPVYLFGLAIGYLLVRAISLEPAVNNALQFSQRERRWVIGGYAALAALYVLPRSGYLLEGLFGYAIDAVCWDDYWHIQEMNSLINTAHYPAVSSFPAGNYLSHYYCAWMILVFLYKLLPFGGVTIKVLLFIGQLVYTLLILAAVGYFSYLVSRTKRQFYVLQYLVLLFSGAGSLLVLIQPLVSHKWWMWDLLGIRVQISDFSDLTLWVVHHLVAAFSLFLTYLIYEKMKRAGGRGTWWYRITIAILLAGAFYSSVFVFLSACLFIGYVFLRDRKTHAVALLSSGILSAMLVLPVLWIYLEKKVGFGFFDSVPAFSVVLFGRQTPLLDLLLGGIIFCAAMSGQMVVHAMILRRSIAAIWRERSEHFYLMALSVAFLLSTAVLSYQNGNDFAMRGAILPVMILGYVVSCYVDLIRWSRAMAVALVLFSLGSLNETLIFHKTNIRNLTRPPESIELRKTIYRYNTDRTVRVIDEPMFGKAVDSRDDFSFYVIEKLINHSNKHLWPPDTEIINQGPFGIWKYQRGEPDPLLSETH